MFSLLERMQEYRRSEACGVLGRMGEKATLLKCHLNVTLFRADPRYEPVASYVDLEYGLRVRYSQTSAGLKSLSPPASLYQPHD
jgi:hypothetical protein